MRTVMLTLCTKQQADDADGGGADGGDGECVWRVISAVRLYQQLLHVQLQHRPELLDSLYYATIKVCHMRCQSDGLLLTYYFHPTPTLCGCLTECLCGTGVGGLGWVPKRENG